MSYYECKRCKYRTKLKSDMKRHLNRAIKCGKDLDAYNYTDNELNNISLTIIKDEKLIKNTVCDKCNKNFSRIDSLNRHKRMYCKDLDKNLDNKNLDNKNLDNKISNNNQNQNNLNVQNNIDKQININIEKQVNNFFILDKKDFDIKSFDDNWNIEHFDNYIKLFILLSKTKFTDFLLEVLKNKENLNVILEKNSESGLVYKTDNYVKLKTNEILDKSMHKIYEHLQKIYDEYKESDFNIEQHFFDSMKITEETITNKYNDYIKNNDIKKQVDNCLLNIYNDKKDFALELANNIKKLGY